MNEIVTRTDQTPPQIELIWQRRVDALVSGECSEDEFMEALSSLPQAGADSERLNALVRTKRVIGLTKRWVEQGDRSFWAFCVQYLDRPPRPASDPTAAAAKRGIDYKEILSAEEFAVFVKLRDWRRAAAQVDGMPVFAIFNNQQLAAMVQNRVRTAEQLGAIAGVGAARVEKHGAEVLRILAEPGGAGAANGVPF